ncbi:DUF4160 domain-containing protein [Aquimarina sp. ERC-38]|uniref:DUF4160 domain-containing protein n=1 Tax=Aquimarina sp. ERC-38 TaxID=2949996 RepID=UPI0022485D5A|nr:DUF4160 domain-containing protein [Aquimarina sp. ERC-38]UZO81948.1 DUF4160 domain-containing protein [Aquimarina sp. ERC-38]
MPTVIVIRGYRFFFYSNDHEPIHIHVEKDNKTAKINLVPLELVKSRNFTASELKIIRKLVEENQLLFIDKWNEFFNN